MTRLTRRIHATLAEVADMAAAAQELCMAAGADEGQALRLGLALDELGANALVHGALDERAPFIEIDVWVEDHSLHLKVEAEGPRFDPREPRAPKDDAAYAIGGRGLGLVISFADSLAYQRVGDRNVTTFVVSKRGGDDD